MSSPILILIVLACFAPFLFVTYCWPLISRAKNMEPVSTPKTRSPIIGETWLFDKSDGSPWPKDGRYHPVKILDVCDGWVRYDIGGMFNDSRMRLDSFLRLYQPAKEKS